MDSKKESETHINDWHSYLFNSRGTFNEKWNKLQKSALQSSDFIFIRMLNDGACNQVKLSKKNSTLYAIKTIKKNRLTEQDARHLQNEIRVLQAARFPFIIDMKFFFTDKEFYYLVMPFIPGGDLWYYLRKVEKFPERESKFFASQVLLALEYLHFMQIIHRDLKPENILVNADGYLKLADLGFCKRIDAMTYTLCGTTEYLPPEVLLGKGHGFAADWWSFGVLLYEMSAGYTPFLSRNESQTYDKISQGMYVTPADFTNDLKDLILNLLVVDTTKRFGGSKSGVTNIKSHSWFKQINWMYVLNKRLASPILPKIELNQTSEAEIDDF